MAATRARRAEPIDRAAFGARSALRGGALSGIVLALAVACGTVPGQGDGDAGLDHDAGIDGPRGGSLGELVREGTAVRSVEARPAFAPIALRGPVRLEARRDGAGGQQRRVVHEVGWQVTEADHEVFHDVIAHPSGAITLALEHTDRDRGGFALRRYTAAGIALGEDELEVGATLPEVDRAGLPTPPWRMRAAWIGALEGGWISMAARGEGLVVLFQSLVNDDTVAVLSGLSWLARDGDGAFVEVRTRVVDGPSIVAAAGWNYDELRWIDALVRPLLAADDSDGAVVVGRAFTSGRCRANLSRFGELDALTCFERACGNSESRQIPFFFTVFDAEGERLGSHIYAPEGGFYFGTFGMAAQDGEIALCGAVAPENAEGGLDLYPSSPGAPAIMVPFDAVIARLDRAGAVRMERRVDRGRADTLLAVRYVSEAGDLVAVGATDWDRHDGGMSVSRGSDPLLVHLAPEGALTHRAFDEDAPARHALFYDLARDAERLRAAGVIDAPMTHSGDGNNHAATTVGALAIELR